MGDTFGRDVGVIGGGGHVGLPLSLILAEEGLRTVIHDTSRERLEEIRAGRMPFLEEGGDAALARALESGRLEIEDRPDLLADCRFLVLVVGTPVDEHLNPQMDVIHDALDGVAAHLRDGQILILRSTVFPGTSEHVQARLDEQGVGVRVAFCPERVAQGHSLKEIRSLPQIISAFDAETLAEVRGLFGRFVETFIEMTPKEAELTKLITNAWRYLQFAIVNQFYMLATEDGLDFDKILHGCTHDYPRMAGLPRPGFAAGPCLMKDTMQLGAFSGNSFVLGHAAMLVNEGLPNHLIQLAKREHDLRHMTVGVLGMAFKAESDDARDSLSYKLKKLLRIEAREVLCTDPYVRDDSLLPLEEVIERSDLVFVGVPHAAYRGMRLPEGKAVVDLWGCVPPVGGAAGDGGDGGGAS